MTTVTLVEVGPRDGLQNAPTTLTPLQRAELIRRLDDAGLTRYEAVSFVNPARVPQMAGAEEVIAHLDERRRSHACGLVLNERGFDRLVTSGLRDVRFTVGASTVFNQRNAGATTEDGAAAARRSLERARALGFTTGFVIATSFGCPYTGWVDPGRVIELAAPFAELGVDEIGFADTIGVAGPGQVRRLVERGAALGVPIGVHLHNTRNTGYANVYAALEGGATTIDAAIGGLGGCPFAPGATGNVATEDVLYLLEREGVAPAVDMEGLKQTAMWLRDTAKLTLPGQLHTLPPYPPESPLEALSTT